MKVYFIGAGPGDPELITVKGKRIIESSGYCIYAGSLVNKDILNYCSDSTKIYDSASMALDEIIKVMEEANDKSWIRGGIPSRQTVKNINYKDNCLNYMKDKHFRTRK